MPLESVFDKQFWPRAAQGMAGSFNQAPNYPIAANQTIVPGDWLSLSGGAVQQAIALPGSNYSATLSGGALPLLGIAGDFITTNASGVDTTNLLNKTSIPIWLWDGNLELALRTWNATASSTPITNFTLGTSYQLGRYRGANASTWIYFVSTTTTNGEIQYVEPYGQLPYLASQANNAGDQLSTDTYPMMWTRVNSAYRQVGA